MSPREVCLPVSFLIEAKTNSFGKTVNIEHIEMQVLASLAQ